MSTSQSMSASGSCRYFTYVTHPSRAPLYTTSSRLFGAFGPPPRGVPVLTPLAIDNSPLTIDDSPCGSAVRPLGDLLTTLGLSSLGDRGDFFWPGSALSFDFFDFPPA